MQETDPRSHDFVKYSDAFPDMCALCKGPHKEKPKKKFKISGDWALLAQVWFCVWLGSWSENWVRSALVFTLVFAALSLIGDMSKKNKDKNEVSDEHASDA